MYANFDSLEGRITLNIDRLCVICHRVFIEIALSSYPFLNNENNNKMILRALCLKFAPSGNRRCMLLFLIFTIVTITPLIITSNVDNNNTNSNNVANALTQKNVKLTSNINNSKATTKPQHHHQYLCHYQEDM